MSVTFFCPLAPVKRAPCPWCEPGASCESGCSGSVSSSVVPEPCFSNVNARDLLDLLGFNPGLELTGSCSPAEMRRAIIRARNSDRSRLVRLGGEQPRRTRVEGGALVAGPLVIEGGNTDNQTLARLDALEALALQGYRICWG